MDHPKIEKFCFLHQHQQCRLEQFYGRDLDCECECHEPPFHASFIGP